jgi:hypothetical protein
MFTAEDGETIRRLLKQVYVFVVKSNMRVAWALRNLCSW